MAKASNSKYTPAMVYAIVAKSEALKAEGRKLNLEAATELANTPDFEAADVTPRGVVAKIRSLGLDYENVVRTDKAGEPVERKEETAARIAQMLGVKGVESLAKAEKATLRTIAKAIAELVGTDETADA